MHGCRCLGSARAEAKKACGMAPQEGKGGIMKRIARRKTRNRHRAEISLVMSILVAGIVLVGWSMAISAGVVTPV